MKRLIVFCLLLLAASAYSISPAMWKNISGALTNMKGDTLKFVNTGTDTLLMYHDGTNWVIEGLNSNTIVDSAITVRDYLLRNSGDTAGGWYDFQRVNSDTVVANNLLMASDTFGVGGEAFTSITGNGLVLSSGALTVGAGTGITVNANDVEATLGTAIVTGEITDGTVLEADLNVTNAPTGLDNYLLSLNEGSNNFTWVASGGGGETNTLGDTGTFNNTEGFGLAGGKTGVMLKVKGLIEGSNITITKSGDSALSIAASGAGLTYFTEADDNDTSVFTATGPNTTIGFNDHVTLQGNSLGGVGVITAAGDITLDDGVDDSPLMNWRDADNYVFHIAKYDGDGSARLGNNEGAIHFYPSNDNNDFLKVSTASNIITLETVASGDGDLVIKSGGGDISFDNDNLSGTGAVDFGGATSVEIPNSNGPTVNAAGEIAVDIDADGTGTAGYIDQGWLTYFDGTQQMYVPAFDAIGTPSDNDVVGYDAGTDKWLIQAQTGGAGEANTASDAGSGFQITHPKAGVDLPFKTFTGGNAITLDTGTANQLNIAFDGGATPAGELGGTWASPTVSDVDTAGTKIKAALDGRVKSSSMTQYGIVFAADPDSIISSGTWGHGYFLVGRGAAEYPLLTAMSGDGSLNNTGVLTIGAAKIDTGMFNDTEVKEYIADIDSLAYEGNVETRVTVTYQSDNTVDFVVDDMNDDIPEAGDYTNLTLNDPLYAPTTGTVACSSATVSTGAANGVRGIAKFDDASFSIGTNGATIKADGVSNTQLDESDNFTWTGTHDYGDATSLEIPAVDNPTTDAEGEIAWDANDDAIEVYMGDEGESALIPAYQKLDVLIYDPDGVNDEVCIFHVDALLYPFGIEIDQVSIQLPADAAYSMVIEEWTTADPPAYEATISTVTTGSADTYAEEVAEAGTVETDKRIYLDIPATVVDWIHVQIIYHVTGGN